MRQSEVKLNLKMMEKHRCFDELHEIFLESTPRLRHTKFIKIINAKIVYLII